MEEREFLDRVLQHIPRATGREKKEIHSELAAHMEDRILELEEAGCSREEAKARAVEYMGDAEEIGKAFNEQLSMFWLWVQVIAQGCTAFLVFLMLSQLTPAEQFRIIKENWMARCGEIPMYQVVLPPYDTPYYRWDSGAEMRIGDSVVRLIGADVNPYVSTDDIYLCTFVFCTYRDQMWKPARDEIFRHITVTAENEDGIEWPYSGWQGYPRQGGYSEDTYQDMVSADATYVDVVYDYMGIHEEMRCEIQWEERIWEREED